MTSIAIAQTAAWSHVTWALPATMHAPAVARRQVAEQLAAWRLTSRIGEAELVVSELVTNAVTHGRGAVWHSLRLIDRHDGTAALAMEVADRGDGWDGRPVVDAPDEECCHGRGLLLVDAMATSWGNQRLLGGHTVWARFVTPLPAEGTSEYGDPCLPDAA